MTSRIFAFNTRQAHFAGQGPCVKLKVLIIEQFLCWLWTQCLTLAYWTCLPVGFDIVSFPWRRESSPHLLLLPNLDSRLRGNDKH